jgi:hypothetical protein
MLDRVAITKLLLELARRQVITEQMARDLEHQFNDAEQERFDDFLLQEGVISKEDLLQALSQVYQVPSTDVEGYFFQTHLLQMFPENFLIMNGIIPMERDENILVVVASDPTNPELLPRIGEHVSYDIEFFVGIYTDIKDAIEEYYDRALTEDFDHEGEPMHEDMVRLEDLDDLPVAQEDRDQSAFLKDKIDDFAKTESELERDEVDRRARYGERK